MQIIVKRANPERKNLIPEIAAVPNDTLRIELDLEDLNTKHSYIGCKKDVEVVSMMEVKTFVPDKKVGDGEVSRQKLSAAPPKRTKTKTNTWTTDK